MTVYIAVASLFLASILYVFGNQVAWQIKFKRLAQRAEKQATQSSDVSLPGKAGAVQIIEVRDQTRDQPGARSSLSIPSVISHVIKCGEPDILTLQKQDTSTWK